MLRAVDLFRQGKSEELWQMCCGFLSLSIDEFMGIQERLLLQQMELLRNCPLGRKIMRGARPETVEEFRRQVPLTVYKDYCPELLEKNEETLPGKPERWVHSSGWSDEYKYKWVPMTPAFSLELSRALYGIGMLSCCKDWGDTSNIPNNINILYSVAPRPYISGTFADLLRMQWPFRYLPPLEEAEDLQLEERISQGFQQAITEGLDYFFGISLVLVKVGEKIRDSSQNIDIRPFLTRPRALWNLTRGKIKSRLAGRPMLPRDIWSIKGIIGSGVDSLIYKDRVKELWGKNTLDLYACSEGGVIAVQTWDYNGLTFFPQFNFLEFIPEDEQLKLQMDRSYKPRTVLLDEVKAGQSYEIIITNFHGGPMTRYRIGDMIQIQSLRNDALGIGLPQMAFERRVDDFLDFYVVRFSEKNIWQAIESTGVAYEDWIAYKEPGNQVLNIGIELKGENRANAESLASAIYQKLAFPGNGYSSEALKRDELSEMASFSINVNFLPKGTFAGYIARRRAEGADLAHLKPPHVNPADKVLAVLTATTEETIVVTRSGVKTIDKSGADKVTIS